jgi:cardiolipin synthase
VEQTAVQSDRLFTLPNLVSVLRLLGVPVFLWLVLVPKYDVLAVIVLMIGGFTDWLDGKLARWLNQTSRIGALLDPAADRLYIFSTAVAFVIRGIIPWWVAGVLILKDVAVAACVPFLRRAGYSLPEVHYIGKAGTFCLLYAFPLLLLAQGDSTAAVLARPIGYAFTIWGGGLYLWSGVLYLIQVGAAMRHSRRS